MTNELETLEGAVLAASLDPVVVVDLDGRIVEFNPAATSTFGFSRGRVLGRRVDVVLVPPRYRDAHRAGMDTYRETGHGPLLGTRFETVAMRVDGSEVPIEISMVPVASGGRTLVAGFIRDLSERKRSERRLRKERDRAELANQAKSRFLAHMSHEIRTPLNGILGMLSLLDGTSLGPSQKTWITTARESGEALLAIINDILDFSKIEAGALELEEQRFAPLALVESAVALFAHRAHAKGIELTTSFDPRLPQALHGDSGRLRQVLLNLLGNAVKFTNGGGVGLRVRLEARDGKAAQVRFEVEDTGIGIPPAAQTRLFEEFRQADQSNARRYGGTGLGLAISQRLVRLMGGEIRVDSIPGRGSRFWMSLPFPCSPDAGATGSRVLEGVAVTLVSEQDLQRRLLDEQLTDLGARVVAGALPPNREPAAGAQPDSDAIRVILVDDQVTSFDPAPWVEGAAARTVLLISPQARGLDPRGFDATLEKPASLDRLGALTGAGAPAEATAGRSDASAFGGEGPPPAAPAPGGRLLVAEDSVPNQIYATALLREAGYEVVVVGNGREAVEAVRERPFDLVLMDLCMPEMDGIEAARAIRRLSGEGARTPIVALTANVVKEDLDRCLAAGMQSHLSKPVDKGRLLAAVRQHLGAAPAGAPAASGAAPESQPVAASRPPVLSELVLERLEEDISPEMVPVMLRAFLDESGERLHRIAEAAAMQDMDTLEGETHTLKSTAGTFGAIELQQLCHAIETACRSGDPGRALHLSESMEPVARRATEALRARAAGPLRPQ